MPSVRNMAWGLLAAAAVATASDVTQLKKDTFDAFVKENDIVLAECMFSPRAPTPSSTADME
jgi:protein disulfide-isomerase A1